MVDSGSDDTVNALVMAVDQAKRWRAQRFSVLPLSDDYSEVVKADENVTDISDRTLDSLIRIGPILSGDHLGKGVADIKPVDPGGGGEATDFKTKWVKIAEAHADGGLRHEIQFKVAKETKTEVVATFCRSGSCEDWANFGWRKEVRSKSGGRKSIRGQFHKHWEAQYQYKLKKYCSGVYEGDEQRCSQYTWYYDIFQWTGDVRRRGSAFLPALNQYRISLSGDQSFQTTYGKGQVRTNKVFSPGLLIAGVRLKSETRYNENTRLFWTSLTRCNRKFLYGSNGFPTDLKVKTIYSRTEC